MFSRIRQWMTGRTEPGESVNIMNKKSRRIAQLSANAAISQLDSGPKFEADRMVRMLEIRSVLEVLRAIKNGGPEWVHRYVTMWFPGPSNGWVRGYPLQGVRDPYFDFMYTSKEPPLKALAVLFEKYPQCTVIDWSPGRFACIMAHGADVEALAEIIREVVEMAWGERITAVSAAYEELGRA